ncbi:MAG: hypothetical protein R3D85_08510 [Paracoccaceae bacterium]
MIAFLKKLGVIVGLATLGGVLMAVSPQIAVWYGAVVLGLSGLALIRPLPSLGLGHRGFALWVFLGVGMVVTAAAQGEAVKQRDTRLAALKASDTGAYLAELRALDPDRWLTELKEIDPQRHAEELARIAAETARREAEARETARTEAAALRERECGEKNETLAFVMSQDFVKRQLKAPSTAEFPAGRGNYRSQAVGDCTFRVSSYVDAQNGFGAMLRTHYSATMVLFPSQGSWSALEVKFN